MHPSCKTEHLDLQTSSLRLFVLVTPPEPSILHAVSDFLAKGKQPTTNYNPHANTLGPLLISPSAPSINMAPFSLSHFNSSSSSPLQSTQSPRNVDIPFSIVEGIGFHRGDGQTRRWYVLPWEYLYWQVLAAHQFKDKRNTDIVLIPQPSDDINDPLNWPSWKKTLAFAPIVIFTALGTWVIGGLGTALVLLMIEFGKDLNDTATGLISWSVLAFGAGVYPPVPEIITVIWWVEFFLGSSCVVFR